MEKPVIALAMGDPCGISPELTAKVVALDEVRKAARVVVIGDRRVFDEGVKAARLPSTPEEFIDLKHLDPATVQRGVASKAGGASALANYRHALRMAADGKADAVCFTPFNKQAMRLAEPTYDDEILFTSNVLGFKGLATEFNVLDDLWNARVTSHIPLAEVSANLSIERIVAGLEITAQALRAAGFQPPRIGVAALNPHAGEEGLFGQEERDILAPAIEAARDAGVDARGPYPADTLFARAARGDFDCVLALYHDQATIAVKTSSFGQAVNMTIGLPFLRTSVDHGTAWDIAGQGTADPASLVEALRLAARLAPRAQR